jgi:DNA-binding MarR family transcriptional regulator
MYRLSHEQGRDECYIKMHNLAEMSNLTYRYCQKVVRSLEQLGWITKLRDYDPTDQLGVLYRINLKPSTPLP